MEAELFTHLLHTVVFGKNVAGEALELFITPDQLNRYTASSQKIFEELFQ